VAPAVSGGGGFIFGEMKDRIFYVSIIAAFILSAVVHLEIGILLFIVLVGSRFLEWVAKK